MYQRNEQKVRRVLVELKIVEFLHGTENMMNAQSALVIGEQFELVANPPKRAIDELLVDVVANRGANFLSVHLPERFNQRIPRITAP